MNEIKPVAWLDPDGSRVITASMKENPSFILGTSFCSIPLVPESALSDLIAENERLRQTASRLIRKSVVKSRTTSSVFTSDVEALNVVLAEKEGRR